MSELKITLGHGSGGELSHKLITETIDRILKIKDEFGLNDAALLSLESSKIAISTDSYIIDPPFFPGGDIGKLAVTGTVNDLLMSGAKPRFLSLALIIEEGFSVADLEKILESIHVAAGEACVKIATGDTKVLPGRGGKNIYINTAGIGTLISEKPLIPENVREGDEIILTGTLGDHSAAVMIAREKLAVRSEIMSDCAQLSQPVLALLDAGCKIRCMRDPTRGGLAAVLTEIAGTAGLEIYIEEASIPINREVNAVCEILGIDPLYMANEGKAVIFCSPEESQKITDILQEFPITAKSAPIGVVKGLSGGMRSRVILKTITGGERIVTLPMTEQLPRIC
jgi:hydrogenase expression/formation protein HypE